jgi:hypothetical protein
MAALSRASLRIWQLVYSGNMIFRYHVVDAIPLPVDESGWTLTAYDSWEDEISSDDTRPGRPMLRGTVLDPFRTTNPRISPTPSK